MIPCVFSPGKESDAARVFPFMALGAPVVLGKTSFCASLSSADGNKFIGSYTPRRRKASTLFRSSLAELLRELLLKMRTAYFHLTDVQFVKCAWPCPIKLAFHSRQLVERIARALLHCSLAGSLIEHFDSKCQARVLRFRIMACLKPLGFCGLMLLFIYLFLNFFPSFFLSFFFLPWSVPLQ